MQSAVLSKTDAIRALNDHARSTFTACAVMVTSAFQALPTDFKARALQKVRLFSDFDGDNDPHHEHDMGFFDESGERFFWKFDYYAPNIEHGSDNPADVTKTRRVLTIGLASDY